MIRIASQPKPAAPEWHATFLRMLPAIRQHARIAFRHLRAEAREEAIQGVVCNACAAIARLAELGKLDLAYPTVLARYGVAQVKDGRMTGGHLNCKDISSPYCQRLKGVVMETIAGLVLSSAINGPASNSLPSSIKPPQPKSTCTSKADRVAA